jgi:disulfide bond formation protein DsbB
MSSDYSKQCKRRKNNYAIILNMKLKKYLAYLPYFVFVVALLSTLISLFFSEILKFVPCVLCWYQRIFMYPMVFVSAISIMRKQQKDLQYYILPLSIIGFLIALYQNLLVWKILPEQIAPCTAGVSCIDQPFVLFGFVTIPLGSMISFAIISLSMILYAKFSSEKQIQNGKSKIK